jgi:hypothetical protein
MKVQLRAAVQRKSNKRCMLSSLSCVVILMRVIYYISLVLYFYSGLHKRLLRWVTWRTHKVTWTPRLLPKLRRVTHTRLRVTLQKHQLHVQVCTISGRNVGQAIHSWKHLKVKIPTQ